jgi:glycosyltransferase involved in cell wall biosynthesis
MIPTGRRTEPGLSVFLPNYNHARFLPTALDAILAQTVLPGRIFIVDDASTDDSRAVIERYASRHPDLITARFLDRNRGCLPNINEWLQTSQSEFIFLAAADDAIFPNLFEESIALLRRFPEAGVCSAHTRHMDEKGTDLGRFRSWEPLRTAGYITPRQAHRFLLTHDSWFNGTTTVYRGATLRALNLDPELGGFADGFTCRVIALRDGACFIPRELASWRKTATGMAAQDVAVPSTTLRITAKATKLMRETYGDLFSEKHARRWKRRWLYWAVVASYDLPPDRRRDALRELLAPFPRFQRTLLSTLSALRLGRKGHGVKLAAFLLLRPHDFIPSMGRIAVHIVNSMFERKRPTAA